MFTSSVFNEQKQLKKMTKTPILSEMIKLMNMMI